MVRWVAGEMENKAIFQVEVEVEVGAWQLQLKSKILCFTEISERVKLKLCQKKFKGILKERLFEDMCTIVFAVSSKGKGRRIEVNTESYALHRPLYIQMLTHYLCQEV